MPGGRDRGVLSGEEPPIRARAVSDAARRAPDVPPVPAGGCSNGAPVRPGQEAPGGVRERRRFNLPEKFILIQGEARNSCAEAASSRRGGRMIAYTKTDRAILRPPVFHPRRPNRQSRVRLRVVGGEKFELTAVPAARERLRMGLAKARTRGRACGLTPGFFECAEIEMTRAFPLPSWERDARLVSEAN